MTLGHEWLVLFAAIVILGAVVWLLWRRVIRSSPKNPS